MPTLLLVDGSSYLYRAFHALPELRNKAGEPTGAVYGVISMLRRLLADYKAQHPEMADESILRAVVFDAKGKTFREDWYPQYKAHRPPMPDELVQQIEPLHACIRASGWPLLMVEGVEADDVIGTLAAEATAQGMDCLISTGDKDLAQLVNPQVTLVNTMTGERLDVAGVQQKFGVPPERIVDYLALVGDAVDGVPGVAKVGPKTAVKWLAQYGTLEGVMAHAAEIGGVVGENLRQALDFLPLGRRLLTVVCTVPLSPAQTVAQLLPQPVDRSQLIECYTRLEFKTWLREVSTDATAAADSLAPAAASSGSSVARGARSAHSSHSSHSPVSQNLPGLDRSGYQVLLDPSALEQWLARIEAAPLTALDTETTDLDPFVAQLVGISFAVEETSGAVAAAYLPLAHDALGAPAQLPMAETLERLRPWLESEQHAKLGQHLKFDRHVFANHGITLRGIVADTLLESYVLESDKSHDLGALATRHLGVATLSYDALTG
ncbi:MAG: DNA polymerase I, partial [Sterolibacterium sp.]|nr:DNA polymerase I [Sterolibacterium sp.]